VFFSVGVGQLVQIAAGVAVTWEDRLTGLIQDKESRNGSMVFDKESLEREVRGQVVAHPVHAGSRSRHGPLREAVRGIGDDLSRSRSISAPSGSTSSKNRVPPGSRSSSATSGTSCAATACAANGPPAPSSSARGRSPPQPRTASSRSSADEFLDELSAFPTRRDKWPRVWDGGRTRK
jgi:hypothetical protein